MKTIRTLDHLAPILDRKIILVGGCFDIIHIGHVRFLKAAKEHGDYLVVALESDEFIQLRKKRQAFHNQQERAEVLAALEAVNEVILLPLMKDSQDYEDLVKNIKPAVIAITEGDPQEYNKRLMAEKYGAELAVVIPNIPSKSTSGILETKPSKTELA
jgi:cytidyltransferase-like protein